MTGEGGKLSGKTVSVWVGSTLRADYERRAARLGLDLKGYVTSIVGSAGTAEDAAASMADDVRVLKALSLKILDDQQAQNQAFNAKIEELETRSIVLSEALKAVMTLAKTGLGDLGFIRNLLGTHAESGVRDVALREEEARHRRIDGVIGRLDEIEREILNEAQG